MGDCYFNRNKTNSSSGDIELRYDANQWRKEIFDDEPIEELTSSRGAAINLGGCKSLNDFLSMLKKVRFSCNPDGPDCVERIFGLYLKGADLSDNKEFRHCRCHDLLKEHDSLITKLKEELIADKMVKTYIDESVDSLADSIVEGLIV